MTEIDELGKLCERHPITGAGDVMCSVLADPGDDTGYGERSDGGGVW